MEIAPVQRFLTGDLWLWSGLLLILAGVLCLAFTNRLSGGGAIYVLSLPFQTAGRLRQLVTPRPNQGSAFADWHSFQPIRSEHWGEYLDDAQRLIAKANSYGAALHLPKNLIQN